MFTKNTSKMDDADYLFEQYMEYRSGESEQRSHNEALAMLNRAAELGHTEARMWRISLHIRAAESNRPSFIISEDILKEWVDQMVSEDNPSRLKNMSDLLDIGYFSDNAKDIMVELAESGDDSCFDALLSTYDAEMFSSYGLSKSESDDDSELFPVALKAAENGSRSALQYLAIHYFCGNGVERSLAKAKEIFEKLADTCYDSVDYLSVINRMISKGIEDFEELFANVSENASEGEAEDQYLLALCYKYGLGVEKSEEMVTEWAFKSADQDYALALNLLVCQGELWGPDKIDMCERSAKQGNARAYYLMGLIYHNVWAETFGNGTEHLEKAIECLKKADELGFNCKWKIVSETHQLEESLSRQNNGENAED